MNRLHLVGTLPTELGKLDQLEELFVGWSELQGTVPSE
eukprot:CAMPEP_0198345950 /NCGR_PEP_ID=MMETSP1450-20131203/76919_1 /TAXON_ID=753684 ORGANISM="Madagascaria erythrocladiodes, Strain CCMP3234" /NCGR_SAMPLE_ID=MMETSP1450 /ASSEMBLY_ACC=CAM_ASM_001115 /LENGTH=37 /DNA_ID= /DNA_START= /DNA_END= /DNA_ORIENTATION=